MNMKHLVLVDGHHLMHRAYWAIPRTLKTKTGEPSNVSFGMASMLLAIFANEEPDAVVMCFDAGSSTFRHEEYKEYKAGRSETPDDFYVQIPTVLSLVDAFALPEVSSKEYEADDYLASYAKAGEAAGMRVTVITGDKDAFQLASDVTRVAIPHKGYSQAEYLGPAEIEIKMGIRPDQVAAFKGLSGDSSDNLKGVDGIGPKTASTLLQKYQTLEGIYDHLDKIRPSVREKLERDREQAFFCQRMAELVCDIDLPQSIEDVTISNVDPGPLLEFFEQQNFTLLTKRLLRLMETEFGKKYFDTEDLPEIGMQKEEPKNEKESSQLSLF
jgi:DNA polymerase-1